MSRTSKPVKTFLNKNKDLGKKPSREIYFRADLANNTEILD